MPTSSEVAVSRASFPALATALAVAAGVGFLFDAASQRLFLASHSASYLLLCFSLAGLSALAQAALFRLLRLSTWLAPGLWVASQGWLLNVPWPVTSVLAVATSSGVYLLGRRGTSPVRDGLLAAAVLSIGTAVGPKLAWRLTAGADEVWVAAVGVLVAAGFVGYSAAEARWSRLPGVSAAGALGLGLLGAALLVGGNSRGAHDGWPALPQREAANGLPDLLVLVLDTVRADHLSIYGYERETTPRLAAFLARQPRARLYPLAFSPAPWTGPAHASLFTGQLPSDHGAHYGTFFRRGPSSGAPIVSERTLAEALRDRGYTTGAIVANSGMFWVEDLDRGFDVYRQPAYPPRPKLLGERLRARFFPLVHVQVVAPYPLAPRVNEEVRAFLDRTPDRPVLLVANYMEAHEPYVPAEPHAGVFSAGLTGTGIALPSIRDDEATLRWLEARYDEEIRSLDSALGDLLEGWERDGRLDDAWLVITSDHGEAFGRHGVTGHGAGLHNDQIRVPLLVLPPRGVELPRVDEGVSLVDVTTTLSQVGGAGPLGVGRDLRTATPTPRVVQAEFFGDPRQFKRDYQGEAAGRPARAVVRGTTKLLESGERRQVYELSTDPGEHHELGRDASTDALVAQLPPLRREPRRQAEGRATLTPEQEEALRQLGYLE